MYSRKKLNNVKVMPMVADLVLHEKPDHDEIIKDGERLGAVLAEAATRYGSELALPLMNLTLEKNALGRLLGVEDRELEEYKIKEPFCDGEIEALIQKFNPCEYPHLKAVIDAIAYLRQNTKLMAAGISIGPVSLVTKLMANPIEAFFLAGMGVTPEEDPEVRLLNQLMHLSSGIILKFVKAQLMVGAELIYTAEPAANKVYFSPKQIEDGSDVFSRYVTDYNQRLKGLIQAFDGAWLFHCCGEIDDSMLRAFVSLHPNILSLGSSRRLWEDAGIVPNDIILYGNLPSKKFYSDTEITEQQVKDMAWDLLSRMERTGHKFILGTECDVLSVAGSEETLKRKVEAIHEVGREYYQKDGTMIQTA